jgi:hypothetical protein
LTGINYFVRVIFKNKYIPTTITMFKSLLPKWGLFLIGTLGLNLSLAHKTLSAIISVQDGTPQTITSFKGTTDSIQINIGSNTLPSGEISFDLDTTKTNTILFDFDASLITLDINVLVSTELLNNLGEPPAEMNIRETAIMPSYQVVNSNLPPTTTILQYRSEGTITQPSFTPQDVVFEDIGEMGVPQQPFVWINIPDNEFPLIFTGGGVIENGILAGFEYDNYNYKRPIPGVTPEPSSILSILGLGCIGILSRYKQKK